MFTRLEFLGYALAAAAIVWLRPSITIDSPLQPRGERGERSPSEEDRQLPIVATGAVTGRTQI
jgi:hypothetical protein